MIAFLLILLKKWDHHLPNNNNVVVPIDCLTAFDKAQLRHAFWQNCHMNQKLLGKLFLLPESDLWWTRRYVARPHSRVAALLIPFEGEVRFVINDDFRATSLQEKIA